MSIPVSAILARKGAQVHTIQADATLSDAVRLLTEHNIGALVVSGDGRSVDGIISERDVVHAIVHDGLQQRVGDVMQPRVATCTTQTTVDELMAMMTDGRFRHVPVLEDEALAGIVSIGDVVRTRLDELEVQADALESYVTGRQAPG